MTTVWTASSYLLGCWMSVKASAKPRDMRKAESEKPAGKRLSWPFYMNINLWLFTWMMYEFFFCSSLPYLLSSSSFTWTATCLHFWRACKHIWWSDQRRRTEKRRDIMLMLKSNARSRGCHDNDTRMRCLICTQTLNSIENLIKSKKDNVVVINCTFMHIIKFIRNSLQLSLKL